MKATVSKYLNARSGMPNTTSPCVFYKNPGDTITIDSVSIGEDINGNSIWYHCSDDGNYYWSGGIQEQYFLFDDAADLNSQMDAADKNAFLHSFVSQFLGSLPASSQIQNVALASINDDIGLIFETSDGVETQDIPGTGGHINYCGLSIAYSTGEPGAYTPSENIYADMTTPFPIGGSVSNKKSSATGTRGVKVRRNKQYYLMTCYHVACYNLMSNGISQFNQSQVEVNIPSVESKKSTVPRDSYYVAEGSLDRYFDYALISINQDDVDNTIPELGIVSSAFTREDFNKLTPGTRLRCFGCISGQGSGDITQINLGKTKVNYDGIDTPYIYETIQTTRMSVEGDSGGPVIDENNNLVGLIIATDFDANRTLIMPIHQLLFLKSLIL